MHLLSVYMAAIFLSSAAHQQVTIILSTADLFMGRQIRGPRKEKCPPAKEPPKDQPYSLAP